MLFIEKLLSISIAHDLREERQYKSWELHVTIVVKLDLVNCLRWYTGWSWPFFVTDKPVKPIANLCYKLAIGNAQVKYDITLSFWIQFLQLVSLPVLFSLRGCRKYFLTPLKFDQLQQHLTCSHICQYQTNFDRNST